MAPQVPVGEKEVAAIQALKPRVAQYRPRTLIECQGDMCETTYIVHSGWGCTNVDLPDGGRQIADFQIKGDIIGLRANGAKWEESFYSINELVVVELPTAALNVAIGAAPNLAVRFLFALARNSAIRGEHLVNIGRRSAVVRLAHLLLELGVRLEKAGLADADGYECPLTQHDLADTLGLTAIHVNRMLRELRQLNLLSFRGGRIRFANRKAASAFAYFDSEYL